MKHLINPQVDCVFKAILGSDENKPLLLNFLNGILKPVSTITAVTIENPYNEREFESDKLSIVDIKAKDEEGAFYQIEIQMSSYPYLPSRMLYTWSDIYSAQIKSGEHFSTLKPVISIWLLVDTLLKDVSHYHHRFQMFDNQQQRLLSDHCAIHVVELNKWQFIDHLSIEDKWVYFFKEAQHWTALPDEINTPEMRQAMAVLRQFSDKEHNYHLYQARENAVREEKSRQHLYEEAIKEKEEALKLKEEECKLKEEALRREQDALAEQQRLRALLEKAGIKPNPGDAL